MEIFGLALDKIGKRLYNFDKNDIGMKGVDDHGRK